MGFGRDAVGPRSSGIVLCYSREGKNVSGENVLIGLLGRITEVHSTAIDRIFVPASGTED